MQSKEINKLRNKSWMFRGRVKHVSEVTYKNSCATVHYTDGNSDTYLMSQADEWVSDYLPIETGLVTNKVPDMSGIFDLLKGNIDKIQTDPQFIPQAEAVNSTINTMLNMMKVQLQFSKIKG